MGTGMAIAIAIGISPVALPTAALAVTPASQRAREAREELDALHAQAEDAQEAVAQANEALAQAQAAEAQAEGDMAAAQGRLAETLSDSYKAQAAGMLGMDAILGARSMDDLASAVAYQGRIREGVTSAVRSAEGKRDDLATAREGAQRAADEAQAAKDELDARASEVEAKVASLEDEVRASIAAAGSGGTSDASAAYDAAMAIVGGDPARVALIDAAYSQMGVPYGYGSYSPGLALDCSGFTMYCYSRIGVHIPHSSVSQCAMSSSRPLADLLPGDLVFWVGTSSGSGSGSHVAMWLGNGTIIHESWGGVAVCPIYSGWNACGSIL